MAPPEVSDSAAFEPAQTLPDEDYDFTFYSDPVVVAAPLPVVPGPLELEQAAKEITAITAAVIVRVMNPPLRCRQP